jgi:hypothetical protein
MPVMGYARETMLPGASLRAFDMHFSGYISGMLFHCMADLQCRCAQGDIGVPWLSHPRRQMPEDPPIPATSIFTIIPRSRIASSKMPLLYCFSDKSTVLHW